MLLFFLPRTHLPIRFPCPLLPTLLVYFICSLCSVSYPIFPQDIKNRPSSQSSFVTEPFKREINSFSSYLRLPGWCSGKESACRCRRCKSSIPGSGRSPGVGNGNPFRYSCRGNPMDRGAWQATVRGVTESDTTEHTRILPTLIAEMSPLYPM